MRLSDLLTGLGYWDTSGRGRSPYDEFAFSVFTCALDDLTKGDPSQGIIVPAGGSCPVRGERFIFRPHQGPMSIVFWVQPEHGVTTCAWVKPAMISMNWKPALDISQLEAVRASVDAARKCCGLGDNCLSMPTNLGLLINLTRSVGAAARRTFCLELHRNQEALPKWPTFWRPYDGGLVPWMKESLHPEMWPMPGANFFRENEALEAIRQTLGGRSGSILEVELKTDGEPMTLQIPISRIGTMKAGPGVG